MPVEWQKKYCRHLQTVNIFINEIAHTYTQCDTTKYKTNDHLFIFCLLVYFLKSHHVTMNSHGRYGFGKLQIYFKQTRFAYFFMDRC